MMNQKYRANPKIKPVHLASAYSLLILIVVLGIWFSNKDFYWWLLPIIPILYIPYFFERKSRKQNPDSIGFTTNSLPQFLIYQIISWILVAIPVLVAPRLLAYTGLESHESNRRNHFALAVFFYLIAAIAVLVNIWFALGFFLIAFLFHRRSKKYSYTPYKTYRLTRKDQSKIPTADNSDNNASPDRPG